MRVRIMIGLSAVTCLLASTTAEAQNSDYTVAGISAWQTAKTYGFEFAPEAITGETVTRPYDGMNTRLNRTVSGLFGSSITTVAQVVGGQPSVNPDQRITVFRMFSGKTLRPGWTVKSIDVTGNFTYMQVVRQGTSDLSFRVRLAPGGSATLRNVVLTGPAGSNWQDAFVPLTTTTATVTTTTTIPARRDYVVNGTVAWSAAKKYGFEFYPYGSTDESAGSNVSSPRDGAFTYLWHQRYAISFADPCVTVPGDALKCIRAQIAGGALSVPAHARGFTGRFALFKGKKLATGWTVKSLTISSGAYIRQPSYGTNDLSFAMQLSSTATRAASAVISSITLEGPSSAASFEDAFKFGQ